MGTGCGRQNTRLFNAARKLYLRSAIRTLYIKLIIINCLSTRQKDTLLNIPDFGTQLNSFSCLVALSRLISLIKMIFTRRKLLLNSLRTGNLTSSSDPLRRTKEAERKKIFVFLGLHLTYSPALAAFFRGMISQRRMRYRSSSSAALS